jgi:hypothetical protein
VKKPANNLQDDQIAVALLKPVAPSGPNQVWSYDFVFDRCAKRAIKAIKKERRWDSRL